jgi:hypothetical protein
MIRLMLRAHRPHFGRQPKHLYTWLGVVGGWTAVMTMVRTSRSVRKLQEQMIMKASPAHPARGPHIGSARLDEAAKKREASEAAARKAKAG